MNQPMKTPEEEMLDIFEGTWKNTGHMITGSFGPGGKITGTTSYSWEIGGKWLQYTSRLELPGLGYYEVQGGVVFNHQTGKYDAYAINSFGNLMVYQGDWSDDTTLVFTLIHPAPVGSARIVYQKHPDGTIRMYSDRKIENSGFETYFETDMLPAD